MPQTLAVKGEVLLKRQNQAEELLKGKDLVLVKTASKSTENLSSHSFFYFFINGNVLKQ